METMAALTIATGPSMSKMSKIPGSQLVHREGLWSQSQNSITSKIYLDPILRKEAAFTDLGVDNSGFSGLANLVKGSTQGSIATRVSRP